jgi:hypothetical protein
MTEKKGTNRRWDGLNIAELARAAGVSRQAVCCRLDSAVIPLPTVRESTNLIQARKVKEEAKRIAKAEAKRTARAKAIASDSTRTATANIGQWTPDIQASRTAGTAVATDTQILSPPQDKDLILDSKDSGHRTLDTQIIRTADTNQIQRTRDTDPWPWRILKRWMRTRPLPDEHPSKARIIIYLISTFIVMAIIASQNVWLNIKMLLEPNADFVGWGNVFAQILILIILGLVPPRLEISKTSRDQEYDLFYRGLPFLRDLYLHVAKRRSRPRSGSREESRLG